jgi:hypothetical protein
VDVEWGRHRRGAASLDQGFDVGDVERLRDWDRTPTQRDVVRQGEVRRRPVGMIRGNSF